MLCGSVTSARLLLAKLDNASRGARRTRYLRFAFQHPTAPAPTNTVVATLP